jgi:DNA mismatch repair protein MutS2
VIPVRAADRRHSTVRDAIVHGSSATGQTMFVEPLAAVELNNKLVQLAEDESAEIARILAALTELLRGNAPALRHSAETIAKLDSLFARARYARQFDCALPVFRDSSTSDGIQMKLEAARHPVLEAALRREGGGVIPMSLAMGAGETVLVISGPNTGGKTVALKTVGLAALAAQSGIPVTAQAAELPLFDSVLADIGDEQSIAANLSTFSAHMLNLRGMLAAATKNSLVLVDELGTGTAPEEGAALAVALLEEFRARGCLTLATTHHDRLKAYASTTPGVLNAAVEFDTVNLKPTYRLMVGVPGGSSGIAIAERLGLPEHVRGRKCLPLLMRLGT